MANGELPCGWLMESFIHLRVSGIASQWYYASHSFIVLRTVLGLSPPLMIGYLYIKFSKGGNAPWVANPPNCPTVANGVFLRYLSFFILYLEKVSLKLKIIV